MAIQTSDLYLLQDLDDPSRTEDPRRYPICVPSSPSQTGSRRSWSGPTRISVVMGRSVPSCLGLLELGTLLARW